jgi:hypothetical protein
VDTGAFEYHPSISGNWILFGRYVKQTQRRMMLLYDLATNELRVLDTTTGRKLKIDSGQVNGDWATWFHCSPVCNVWRYNIQSKRKSRVPRPSGHYQYASSVTSAGVVFFARSGRGCGASVSLLRYGISGSPHVELNLPQGVDVPRTFAASRSGHTDVLFGRVACPDKGDIYRLVVG